MPLNGVKGSNNGRQTTKGRVIYSVGTIVVLFWVGLLFVIWAGLKSTFEAQRLVGVK